MARPLLLRNRNYRLLFSAGALTNLGDGVVVLALPWLATMLTRDPLAIAAVTAAGFAPWLLFALPAGVVTDRVDRRRLIMRADLLRATIVLGILSLALAQPEPRAVWLLAGLAFLLGCAEVLRDNAAQTILPAIVEKADLEAANGQMWSAEQIAGQFVGPPLAGVLIGIGIALPFGLDAAMLALAAGLVWLIALPHQPGPAQDFRTALAEGIGWMRRDLALLRLALVLGAANFLSMATITTQVLFAQEVLGMGPAAYGVALSVGAAGAVTGSLGAPWMIRRFGVQPCLYLSLGIWAAGYATIGMAGNGMLLSAALFAIMAAAMLWNVITVSWRQRRIPGLVLGRVNSIYRFFGWGTMPLGALAGGAVVAALEPGLGREAALRAPFLIAGTLSLGLLAYGWARLRLD